MFDLKKIIKSAIGVSLIYIMVIVFTVFMCERVNELESSEEEIIYNNITLTLK